MDLSGINLQGANLHGYDFSGTNLSGTNLEEAQTKGMIWDQDTVWPKGWHPNPPSDFDLKLVHSMLSHGRQINADWIPFVTALDFSSDDQNQYRYEIEDGTEDPGENDFIPFHPKAEPVLQAARFDLAREVTRLGTYTIGVDGGGAPLISGPDALNYFSQIPRRPSPQDLLDAMKKVNENRNTNVIQGDNGGALFDRNKWQFEEIERAHQALVVLSGVTPIGRPMEDGLGLLPRYGNLREFSIRRRAITDLRLIGSIIQLRALDLRGSVVGDITPLNSLRNLHVLRLDETDVLDLSPLADLGNLEELYVNDTLVTDIRPIARLPMLRVLELEGTQFGQRTRRERALAATVSRIPSS